ncbi:hypothetical protein AUJ77_02215 [Candidatus Nomurabacteria bacterium CG1_02_43_90]|uniref:histidine kinase n=1 Tax=Candidatus Nomurabacteria bacterium CG1_02_43_90 TaxID=1805281 RepID=A0A1J4V3Q2_9BACT|nr:MAG: hypothetical protein AUJ77_02215 [Candidatus Nomurabacteria bacterium CG1_02_43_90]
MNLFYTSSIILFFLSFFMGFLVYLKDKKNKLNRLWFIFSIFVATWSMLLYLVSSAQNELDAEKWQYALDISALGIPVAYFYFITNFLSLKVKRVTSIIIFGATLDLIFFSTTTLFKVGVIKKFAFFWVDTGPYYFIFPFFFLSLIFCAIALLVIEYRKKINSIERKKQIKYQLIAGAIGFSGGVVNFLPQLFDVFPFGSHIILVYTSIVSYMIFKYRLFNVRLILVEIAIFLLNLFLFLNIFTSYAKVDFILNVSVSVTVFILSTLLLRGIYRDINDREKIAVLAQNMSIANDRLRTMEEQKTEFVSIASHQLRTPLTVIKGYASMILEGTFGATSPTVREAVENLYKSSEKIVVLVEDLLTVSRIEQGRMALVFEKVNLVNFLQDVFSEIITETREAGIDIAFNVEGNKQFFVSIDPGKFKQALRHILDNAIKYTPGGGRIRVSISRENLSEKARIAISDTGIGMSPEQLKSIFESFNLRAEMNNSKSTKVNSKDDDNAEQELERSPIAKNNTMGIGLYIAEEIIDAHNGNLRIESAGTGTGTTVIVDIPCV